MNSYPGVNTRRAAISDQSFNPLVSTLKVKKRRRNRYRVWKPLSLMVVAGLAPLEWEISLVDENLGAPDYRAMPRTDLLGITAS